MLQKALRGLHRQLELVIQATFPDSLLVIDNARPKFHTTFIWRARYVARINHLEEFIILMLEKTTSNVPSESHFGP